MLDKEKVLLGLKYKIESFYGKKDSRKIINVLEDFFTQVDNGDFNYKTRGVIINGGKLLKEIYKMITFHKKEENLGRVEILEILSMNIITGKFDVKEPKHASHE